MSTRLSKLILFIAALLVTRSAFAADCKNADFKLVVMGKEKTLQAETCFEKENDLYLSKSCDGEKICLAKKQMSTALPVLKDELRSSFGSPEGQLCTALKAELQVLEIKEAGKWEPSTRCLFSDGSFVSGAKLYEENESARKKHEARPVDEDL